MDEWSWRAEFARRRLAARYAEEGREHPGFCAALVVARGERGLTIEEMAAELGCGPATLQALEAGLIPPERAPASVRELLAASLGVSPELAVEAAEATWAPEETLSSSCQVRAWDAELEGMSFLAKKVRGSYLMPPDELARRLDALQGLREGVYLMPPDELARRRTLGSTRRASRPGARRRGLREEPPSGEEGPGGG